MEILKPAEEGYQKASLENHSDTEIAEVNFDRLKRYFSPSEEGYREGQSVKLIKLSLNLEGWWGTLAREKVMKKANLESRGK